MEAAHSTVLSEAVLAVGMSAGEEMPEAALVEGDSVVAALAVEVTVEEVVAVVADLDYVLPG